MKIIQCPIICEIEEKKSRFIAHLMPYALYEETRATLQVQHPKANHHVSAFRALNEYDQVVEGAKDDGEPAGTSGPPCLKCLQGADLINVAVIVTRYFGGTKLGTGGLARAYAGATNAAIGQAQLSDWKKPGLCKMSVTFQEMSQFEKLCQDHSFMIEGRSYTEAGVDFQITGPLDDLQAHFGDFPTATISPS